MDQRDGVARSIIVGWICLAGLVMAQEDDIRGAKALIEVAVPEETTSWLVFTLWGLAFIVAITGALWFLRRRKQPEVTAEDRARKELDRLGREGADLEAGDFALAASQVVRDFIERKFGLAAPKRTTEEFLQELASNDYGALRSRMEPLRGFLKSCDMAKFAGSDLGVGERGELVAKARAFVDTPANQQGREAA